MPKSRTRTSLLAASVAPAVAFAGGFAADLTAIPEARLVPAAQAQSNPCAPAAKNPCAPAAANPCAPAAANPCAPAAKPAAKSAMPANPCAAAAVTSAAANPYNIESEATQAPYGDAMPAVVKNYLRAAPFIGTGGVITDDGFDKLAELGFKTIINLNTNEEGAVEEGELAKAAGLDYVSLQVSTKAPTAAQVAEFSKYANDPAMYPILVHCQSSNRVGAMWALYRAANGVAPMIAIQEGRTVGLKTSREEAVRMEMGLSG